MLVGILRNPGYFAITSRKFAVWYFSISSGTSLSTTIVLPQFEVAVIFSKFLHPYYFLHYPNKLKCPEML